MVRVGSPFKSGRSASPFVTEEGARSVQTTGWKQGVGVWLLGISLLWQGSELRAEPERPNVIVIISDDQGWADIGFNNRNVYSPQLDRLASQGATFVNHYVMPQCTPTRVAVMTGRYPGRFGPQALSASNSPAFPLGTPTLGTLFQEAGYETYLIGKWHL